MARAGTTAYILTIAAVFSIALPYTVAQPPPPMSFRPPPPMLPPPAPAPMLSPPPPSPLATAPAPSPALDCFPYLLNLSDCLTFVEMGSNLTKPDAGCCGDLANLVNTQPICLCQLLGRPDSIGIPVDLKKALTLPTVCNVTTPPVSLCAAVGVPVTALTPSEAPSAGPAPGKSHSDGGGPMEGSPSEGRGASSPGVGSVENSDNFASNSNQHFLFGLAVALFTFFI